MTSSWNRKKKLLLSSDSEDEENEGKKMTGGSLAINKDYASRYESWRGKEEIQKHKDRFGASSLENDEDESSSSCESDTEELVNDKQFFKALSCLKKKDPIIYDEKLKFFSENENTTTNTESVQKVKKSKKKIDNKPFLLKDHERKMILECDIDPEAQDDVIPDPKISYFQEQNDIKSKIFAVTSKVSEEDEDDGDLLLKAKKKSTGEIEEEEEDYKKWLKGQTNKLEGGSISKTDEKELKYLRDYWNDPKLDAGEQFLRDYILNRKYVSTTTTTDGDNDHILTYDEIIHDSDGDEEELEKIEEFEQKYNFRFEEPDQEFIKKYPRTIENSIRRKETKRKEERERMRECRKKEKERKVQEIQQLKAFTRKQILNKIHILQKSSGDPSLGFKDTDVDGDFDPDEYDSRTHTIFNDEFYSNCIDDKKPIFSDMEYDDDENFENGDDNFEKNKNKGQSDIPDDDEGFSGTLYDDNEKSNVNEPGTSKKHEKNKKGKRVLEALEKEKCKMNKMEQKNLEEEYYKLDFEDIIGGDIPCRFKYREVIPNDFGLTIEEILTAPDKELNRWSSIKKTYLHRSEEEELYDLHAYGVKKNDFEKKKRLLATLYGPKGSGDEDEDEDEDEQEPDGLSRKKKRKKNKSKNKNKNKSQTEMETSAMEEVEAEVEAEVVKIKKKNKSEASVVTDTVKIKNKPNATASKCFAEPAPDTKGNKKRKRNNKNKNRDGLAGPADAEDESVNLCTSETPNPSGSGSKKKKQKKNKVDGTNVMEKPVVATTKPDRLAAFGINPKKYEKWVKYGGGNYNSTSTATGGGRK